MSPSKLITPAECLRKIAVYFCCRSWPNYPQLAGQLMSSTRCDVITTTRADSTRRIITCTIVTSSLCTGSLEAKWSCCSLLGTSQTESWVQASLPLCSSTATLSTQPQLVRFCCCCECPILVPSSLFCTPELFSLFHFVATNPEKLHRIYIQSEAIKLLFRRLLGLGQNSTVTVCSCVHWVCFSDQPC